jgi:hypothetical protein
MELIKAIVLLCQLHASEKIEIVEKKQLQCQQYYVKCLDNPLNANYKTLSKCIKEKK